MTDRILIAPDRSLIVSDSQMCAAFELYHHFGWDELTAGLPEGATSTDGIPLDRNNPHLQLVAMAECIGSARGDKPGRGMDRMGDESWRTLVTEAVNAYNRRAGED